MRRINRALGPRKEIDFCPFDVLKRGTRKSALVFLSLIVVKVFHGSLSVLWSVICSMRVLRRVKHVCRCGIKQQQQQQAVLHEIVDCLKGMVPRRLK